MIDLERFDITCCCSEHRPDKVGVAQFRRECSPRTPPNTMYLRRTDTDACITDTSYLPGCTYEVYGAPDGYSLPSAGREMLRKV